MLKGQVMEGNGEQFTECIYVNRQHSSVWLSDIHLTDASELHNIVK